MSCELWAHGSKLMAQSSFPLPINFHNCRTCVFSCSPDFYRGFLFARSAATKQSRWWWEIFNDQFVSAQGSNWLWSWKFEHWASLRILLCCRLWYFCSASVVSLTCTFKPFFGNLTLCLAPLLEREQCCSTKPTRWCFHFNHWQPPTPVNRWNA